MRRMIRLQALGPAFGMLILASACAPSNEAGSDATTPAPAPERAVAQSLAMGGAKSVMTFFVTSRGTRQGRRSGGLAGADAHCQALAKAERAGDHTWRAHLSTSALDGQSAVNARDRIGNGPWYNAEELLIAANVDELHSDRSRMSKETAVTERLDPVSGVDDTPNVHVILTGSRPDDTAFPVIEDLTCRNWTSDGEGRAQVGHHDRRGRAEGVNSWNSVHASQGCSQEQLRPRAARACYIASGSI